MISVQKWNETYLRVFSDPGIEQELSAYFEFEVPGARWTPKFKAKIWDGKIRLYNLSTKTLYVGLLEELLKFAKLNDYSINIPAALVRKPIDRAEVETFVDSLDLHGHGKPIDIRQYQIDAIHRAIQDERIFLKSPTACLAGNTLISAEVVD